MSYDGHKVIAAGNGQEALEILNDVRPDLVLSDVVMAVMDGMELCKRLYMHPEHNSIPIVLMSATYLFNDLEGCNYAAVLKKPFDSAELLDAMNRAMKNEVG